MSILSSFSFHLSLGSTLNSSIPSLFDSNRVDSISFSLNLNGIYFHTTFAGPNTHSSIPTRTLGQSPLIRYWVKLSGVPSMLNVILSLSSSIALSFFHHDLLLRLPLVVMIIDLATSLLSFTNSKKLACYIGSPKLPQKTILSISISIKVLKSLTSRSVMGNAFLPNLDNNSVLSQRGQANVHLLVASTCKLTKAFPHQINL